MKFRQSPHLGVLATAVLLADVFLGSTMGQTLLDPSFAPSVTDVTTFSNVRNAMAVQPDGKIILSGDFSRVNGVASSSIVRVTAAGLTDSTFKSYPYGVSTVQGGKIGMDSICVQLDGNITFAGCFDSVGSVFNPRLAKVTPSGSAVGGFYPPLMVLPHPDPGWTYIIQPRCRALTDGRLLVSGVFTYVNSEYRAGMFRTLTNGQVDTTFNPQISPGAAFGGGSYPEAYFSTVQADGKVIAVGDFTGVAGVSRTGIARFETDGSLDLSFNPSANDIVEGVVVQPDQKIIIFGDFSAVAGYSAMSGIARLNPDGSRDLTFALSITGVVYSLGLRADGKIVIVGDIASVGGQTRSDVAVLESNGALSSEYAGEVTSSGSFIRNLAIQGDGKLVVAGTFSDISGATRNRIARFNAAVPASQTLSINADGDTVDWTRLGGVPEVEEAVFAISTNNGSTFTKVNGTPNRTANGWRLTGLSLPGNKSFQLRARGNYSTGYRNWSMSVVESKSTFIRPLATITVPPASQDVVLGDTGVGFSVTATSDATITGYQWKRNGVNIPGATATTYTIPTGVTNAHAGNYTCAVTSTAGTAVSPAATLVVVTPITITKQPVFQAVLTGKPATFSVTVTGSSPEYVWKRDGDIIPGAVASTYKVPSAQQPGNEGLYTVEVSNFAGMVPSVGVRLYVVDTAVDIPDAPASVILPMLHPLHALAANPVSESPALNQWLKAGKPVKGANSNVLNLVNVKLTDAGKYELKASNPAGSDTSTPAEVAVVDQTSVKRFIIPAGGSAVLPAVAAGNGITYQWKHVGGANLADAIPNLTGTGSKALSWKNLGTGDSGFYTCVITAPGGQMESAAHEIVVTTSEPIILTGSLDLPQGMVGAEYGVVGAPYGFPGYPVPMNADPLRTPNKFTATGLPAGLKIDPVTGRITGRPTKAGTSTVTINVSNGSGKGISASDTLEVVPMTVGLVGSFVAVVTTPSVLPASPFINGGRVDLTVTPAGTYSGKVTLGITSHSFSGGKLNAGVGFNDTNTILVKRGSLSPMTLEFDADPTLDVYTLTGKLSIGGEEVPFAGWKKKWTATDKAAQFNGYYTVGLQTPPPPPSDFSYPHGDGYAAFTIADLGTLTVAGKLPDGTAYTTSTGFVGPAGQVMVYQGLYGKTGGTVSGQLTVIPAGAPPLYEVSEVAGAVQWKKGAATGTTYAAGFPSLTLNAVGAKYAVPTGGFNVLGSNVALTDVSVVFTGAEVATAVPSPNVGARLTDKNVFVLPALSSGQNPAGTSLKLVGTTGIMTGGFTIPTDVDPGPDVKIVKRVGKSAGIIVRNAATMVGKGYGFFTLPVPPGDATAPILGGRMVVN